MTATYSWIVPAPPSAGSSGGSPITPTTSSAGGGPIAGSAMSLVIDPLTRDLVDTSDGWFLESTDSRTAVLFQLESTYAAWWADASSGSRLRALIASVDDILAVRDETLRVLQPLVDEGIITDLTITNDEDELKRPVVLLKYRDRSSGQLVDLAYVPFGG